jgi:hypothetical protein
MNVNTAVAKNPNLGEKKQQKILHESVLLCTVFFFKQFEST